MSQLLRKHDSLTVSIAAGVKTSSEVCIADKSIALVHVPSTFTGASVTVQGANAKTGIGTFGAVYTKGGTAVASTITKTGWTRLPDEALVCDSIKLVASSAQATAVTLTIQAKS